jgi:hypothetical protein
MEFFLTIMLNCEAVPGKRYYIQSSAKQAAAMCLRNDGRRPNAWSGICRSAFLIRWSQFRILFLHDGRELVEVL